MGKAKPQELGSPKMNVLPVLAQSEKTKYGVLYPDGHINWALHDGKVNGFDIRTVSGQREFQKEREEYIKEQLHSVKVDTVKFVQQIVYTGFSDITDFIPLT